MIKNLHTFRYNECVEEVMGLNNQGPKALVNYVLKQSKGKSEKLNYILAIQGILAGIYISLGAIGYFKIAASVADKGIGNFLGAVVFPLGIIAIVVMKAELFTSDTMVMTSVYAGKIKFRKIFKILLIIFFSNIIGAVAIALLTNAAGIFSGSVMDMVIHKAIHKVHFPLAQLFFSSVLCNIIVCTAVCLAYSYSDELSKVVVLWLGITVFVLSGTEHVVANMYYLFTAYFGGANISLGGIAYNLVVAGIGNFIGGGIIVSGINYILAYKDIQI